MRTITASITAAALLVMGGSAYINASTPEPVEDVVVTRIAPPEPVAVEVPDVPVESGEVEVSVVIPPLPEEPEPVVPEPSPEPEPVVPVVNACGAGEALAEDGSCVPLDYWQTEYVEPTTEVGSSWDGLLVGDVIVCPEGYEVSIDVTPAGTVWAACM